MPLLLFLLNCSIFRIWQKCSMRFSKGNPWHWSFKMLWFHHVAVFQGFPRNSLTLERNEALDQICSSLENIERHRREDKCTWKKKIHSFMVVVYFGYILIPLKEHQHSSWVTEWMVFCFVGLNFLSPVSLRDWITLSSSSKIFFLEFLLWRIPC